MIVPSCWVNNVFLQMSTASISYNFSTSTVKLTTNIVERSVILVLYFQLKIPKSLTFGKVSECSSPLQQIVSMLTFVFSA